MKITFCDLMSSMLQRYYNDEEITLTKEKTGRHDETENIFRLTLSKNYNYSIYSNYYFKCCGAANLSGYGVRHLRNKDLKKISSVLPLIVMLFNKYNSNINLITLTVPVGPEVCYLKSYAVANNLKKLFKHSEIIFNNYNTKRDVAHICYDINTADINLFNVNLQNALYDGIDNKNRKEILYEQFKDLLDRL